MYSTVCDMMLITEQRDIKRRIITELLGFYHYTQRNSISWVVLNQAWRARHGAGDQITDSSVQLHFSISAHQQI